MDIIMRWLIDCGYMQQYLLKPETDDALWNSSTSRSDGTVLFTLLDPKCFKNRLFLKRTACLLYGLVEKTESGYEESTLSLDEPIYFLQDERNQTTISTQRGTLGGHDRLKIYGRLDCPSALRHLHDGQYRRHRVFFKDEETAIKAGYRPCAVCMKREYKLWREAKPGI